MENELKLNKKQFKKLKRIISKEINTYKGRVESVDENVYATIPDEKIDEIRNLIRLICKKELLIANQSTISDNHICISYNSERNLNTTMNMCQPPIQVGIPVSSNNTYYGYNIYIYKNGQLEFNFDDSVGNKFVRISCPGLYDEFKDVLVKKINEVHVKTLDNVIDSVIKSTGLNRDINLGNILK